MSLLVDKWVPEGTCSQVLRSTSVDRLRASKFSVLQYLFEIVILWVYYTIPFGFSLVFGTFRTSFFNFWKYFLAKDEGSLSKMRIWSIFLINSDLKWCIHLRRSLFLYINYLVSVTASGPVTPLGHMKPRSTVDFCWFVVFESIKLFRVTVLVWNCNFVGWLHHPFWLQLVLARFGTSLFNFKNTF